MQRQCQLPPLKISIFFWDRLSCRTWSLPFWPVLLVSKSLESICPHYPSTVVPGLPHMPGFSPRMPTIQTWNLTQALGPPHSLLRLPTLCSALSDASDRSMSVFLFLLLHGQRATACYMRIFCINTVILSLHTSQNSGPREVDSQNVTVFRISSHLQRALHFYQ